MKQRIDYTKYIVATKQENTTHLGKNGDSSLVTTDRVKLLSYNEIKNLSGAERKKSSTDFALDNFAWQSDSYMADNGKLTGSYWLRAAFNVACVRCVIGNGSLNYYCVSHEDIGLCPALDLDLSSIISKRSEDLKFFEILTHKTENGKKHFLEMGEYPKTVVSEKEQAYLESLYNGGELKSGITATGRLFTTNGQRKFQEDFLSKQNPEFEVDGQRYVRVVVWNDDSNKKYSDGTRVAGTETVSWKKVEPITFEILNWDKLSRKINPKGKLFGGETILNLETEEVILSGIPFYPNDNHDNCIMWQNSLARCFLNSAKSSELDGNPEFLAPYMWDFSKSGFLYQALDLTREPTREYTIPEYEKEIADNAFEGCVGIEKIIVHDGVKNVGNNAFAGCLNTQIVFKSPDKLKFSESACGGTNFKFVYVSQDEVIFAPKIDEELERTHIKRDYDFETLSNVFNGNYRHNFVQLREWKAQKKIKFIPPEYTIQVFPATEMEKYFVNNNNQRWSKLVKTLGFDTLEGIEKNNSLVDLMKIYYAIGGFSDNQGESERAFEYVLNYVAKAEQGVSPSQVGAEIHQRFSKLQLKGEYNKDFALFFMKNYKDNPDFMNFRLKDKDGDLMDPQDYLCQAHNFFNTIQKSYPNRVVTGNNERDLLFPRFVAEHCAIVEYEDVEDGNELLAEIVGRYGYSQDQFEEIQEIYEKAKKIKDSYVIMADKSNDKDPVKFRILEKDDPLGFVLGDITDCCQHIGGAGEECVDDGYVNPNAGFLVFEENIKDEFGNDTGETRILGQAYVWYDPETKTVCYDNIEIPDKVLQELRKGDRHGEELSSKTLMNAVEKSAVAIMRAMNKNGINVERVTTGEGYNDLKRELSERYKKETNPKSQHRGYSGYSDARSAQYIIATYDEVTRRYADKILSTASEARQDLKDIQLATRNQNVK